MAMLKSCNDCWWVSYALFLPSPGVRAAWWKMRFASILFYLLMCCCGDIKRFIFHFAICMQPLLAVYSLMRYGSCIFMLLCVGCDVCRVALFISLAHNCTYVSNSTLLQIFYYDSLPPTDRWPFLRLIGEKWNFEILNDVIIH